MSDRMTLSDILRRDVAIEWYEAVALVRGVIARLLETSTEAPLTPELHQIEISEGGGVNVIGRTIAGEPVRHLGQLLQATLGRAEVPVQLRLLIVQATAPSPAFASIREYDDALAYFERPGRETLLRALYARAAAASVSGFAWPPTLDAVAPLPVQEQPKAAHERARSKSKPAATKIAIAAIALSICAAGASYATRVSSAAGKRDVSAIARKASDAVGAAVLSGLSAVTERTGLGRLVPADAPGGEPPTASETSAAKPSRVKRAAPAQELSAKTIVAFDADAVRDSGTETSASLDPRSAAPSDVAEAVEDDGGPIFSLDSEGVSPPVGVRPQLPRELPPNVKPEQLCRVELIVSETGTVESVKLLRTPRSVHDSMFLSAAKAWHFRPATKDGHPVRFRKIVSMLSD